MNSHVICNLVLSNLFNLFIYTCTLSILPRSAQFFFILAYLRAPESFSAQNMFVVCRWRRCCRTLFAFVSSFQKPLGEFQTNLTQSIFENLSFIK